MDEFVGCPFGAAFGKQSARGFDQGLGGNRLSAALCEFRGVRRRRPRLRPLSGAQILRWWGFGPA
jgi:hypothetical protein